MGLCSSSNYWAAIIEVYAANGGYLKLKYSKDMYGPINRKAWLQYKQTADFSLIGVATNHTQYSRGK